jgi:hypothetical protein
VATASEAERYAQWYASQQAQQAQSSTAVAEVAAYEAQAAQDASSQEGQQAAANASALDMVLGRIGGGGDGDTEGEFAAFAKDVGANTN